MRYVSAARSACRLTKCNLLASTDAREYTLVDKTAEAEFDFKLKNALGSVRRGHKVLAKWTVMATPQVLVDEGFTAEAMRGLVHQAGGMVRRRYPSNSN